MIVKGIHPWYLRARTGVVGGISGRAGVVRGQHSRGEVYPTISDDGFEKIPVSESLRHPSPKSSTMS